MSDKLFRSYEQQLDLLRSRGLEIVDPEEGKAILAAENYYNVINGYKRLFIVPNQNGQDEHYKDGASIHEIHALFQFDNRLRMTCLARILEVERHVKSAIAYNFSMVFGHDDRQYLRLENFDAKEDISHPGSTYAEEMLTYVADDRKKALKVTNSSVRHYADCYGYIPLWVLTNTFSFGTTTSFYRCMRRPEREHVAMRFSLPESVLTRFLVALNFYRNCCAHGGRFYEYKIAHYTIPSTPLTAKLGLQGSAGRPFIQGQGDILALFIMLRHLLEQRPFCDFADEIDSELTELGSSLNTICIDDVTAVMGLSENWRLLRNS